MTDQFEKKWEQSQIKVCQDNRNTIISLFSRFSVDFEETYSKLLNLPYGRQQPAMYLLGKIQKMVSICDFLDELKRNHNEDVDKIKIFQLISHAEIVIKTLSSGKNKAELVSKYFDTVKESIKYRLRLSIQNTNDLSKKQEDTTASGILYKLRNEYAHQGNFTGNVFKRGAENLDLYNIFMFDWDLPKEKKIILVSGETNLTCIDFMNIYFTALKNQLEIYIKK